MGSSLASVEPGYALSSHGHLILRVIVPLLSNEVVTGHLSPVSLNLRHVFKVCQTPAMIMQELINEEEAKVIDLRVTGVRHPMLVLEAIFQVITDMVSEFIPELSRISRITPCEEGHKRSGPFDNSEQSAQIEPLPSCRVGKVDATNGGLKPLARCPSLVLGIPDKVFREFNIVVLLSIGIFGIGLKVTHELGLEVLSTLQYVFSLPNGVKDNSLLIRQVNWKRDHSRMLGVNLIPSQPPKGLRCTDIVCTEILLDLILVLPKLHSSPIMALVDVLVDVLD